MHFTNINSLFVYIHVTHAYLTKECTSLCVGMNFQGIPSATSALNCTEISLFARTKFNQKDSKRTGKNNNGKRDHFVLVE